MADTSPPWTDSDNGGVRRMFSGCPADVRSCPPILISGGHFNDRIVRCGNLRTSSDYDSVQQTVRRTTLRREHLSAADSCPSEYPMNIYFEGVSVSGGQLSVTDIM